MRRALSLAAFLSLAALLWVAGPAHAQKGKAKPKEDAEMKNTEKTVKAGTLVGQVTNVDEGKKIRIKVSYPETTIDQGAIQQVAQYQNQMAQAQLQLRMARDINGVLQARQQMAQAQAQMAQAQARIYKTEYKTTEVYVQGSDDVVVRTVKPIARFDDKGEIKKKFTRAELKELRGPGKLPHYKAEYTDVQVDQVVQVTLVKKKGPKAPAARPKKRKGKEAEDAIADAVGDDNPQVSMIVILRQAAAPAR